MTVVRTEEPHCTKLAGDPDIGVHFTGRIADFIELRLRRHPIMIRLSIHLFDRLPLHFTRTDLVEVCQGKAMIIIHRADKDKTPVGLGAEPAVIARPTQA